jgi:transposase
MSGKRGENDAADAAAICEAVTRPNMRLVSQRGRAVELNAGFFIQPGRARAVTS